MILVGGTEAEDGCVPGYPVTHLQKGPSTLPSAIPALRLQSELAAGDGPATVTLSPFAIPPLRSDSSPAANP